MDEMDETEENEALFTVMLLKLEADCKYEEDQEAWDKGYRYSVQQLDGDSHYFANRRRAEQFIHLHGMIPVSIPEMMKVRDRAGI